jgi:hypothetical protein
VSKWFGSDKEAIAGASKYFGEKQEAIREENKTEDVITNEGLPDQNVGDKV